MPLENTPVVQKSLLSTKRIPANERLIVALDVSSFEEAKKLVNKLGDSVSFYKVGLELFVAGHHLKLCKWLRAHGKKVFADIKIYDVPETAKRAFLQYKSSDVNFVTVHAIDSIMKAVIEHKNGIKLLAVTVLTSLDKKEIAEFGINCDIETLVLRRAKHALKLGCDGVISSGLEAARLRKSLGDRFLIVTPGIRPFSNLAIKDDQKRTVTEEEAFLNGADYIVVGRPITQSADPKAKAEEIQQKIARIFPK